MLFIDGKDNVMAPGVPELHLQRNEDITVILPDGQEIYIYGDGRVSDGSSGLRIREQDQ